MNEKKKTKRNAIPAKMKEFFIGVVTWIADKWNSLHRETRRVLCGSCVTGLILMVAVIVLAVRLGGVTKELEFVQAMSVSLQDELELVKADKKTVEGELSQQSPQEITLATNPTVTPIPTVTPEPKKYIVCVDAGHGDWDGGAVLTENGIEKRAEKNDNLWMATLFRDALEEYGVEVVMTRETDVFLGLSERARIANAANADALISFHRNSYDGADDVNGIEFWIHNSKPEGAETLAQSMSDAVAKVGGLTNRGVKYGTITSARDNYAINREANMTSMIVELGFITSAKDNAAYDTYGKMYAQEMAGAVFEWLEAQNSLEK